MPLELRPAWCLTDDTVDSFLNFGGWKDERRASAMARDGDDWRPGDGLILHRSVELDGGVVNLRRALGLRAGAVLGVAARWSCRSTATAGVHVGGPAPLPLESDLTVQVEIPPTIGGSLEIETCLIVGWTVSEPPPTACPQGALIWSDGWSSPRRERTILLEGSDLRIPVRTVSFEDYFGGPSSALWSIDVDPSIALDDLLANVVTVLLNEDCLEREFTDSGGRPDASQLPPWVHTGISVDLVRCLASAVIEELSADDLDELDEGSVGAMLDLRLRTTFDSVSAAVADLTSDPATFARQLWSGLAPDSWSART